MMVYGKALCRPCVSLAAAALWASVPGFDQNFILVLQLEGQDSLNENLPRSFNRGFGDPAWIIALAEPGILVPD
jgi:hypothetical protein